MGGKRATKKAASSRPSVAAEAVGATVVQLPVDCRLAAQAALKLRLEEVLREDEVVLDVSVVERIDTAALQLLVLFQRELGGEGGKLGWQGASDVLDEAAGVLGLRQLLNLPAATLA